MGHKVELPVCLGLIILSMDYFSFRCVFGFCVIVWCVVFFVCLGFFCVLWFFGFCFLKGKDNKDSGIKTFAFCAWMPSGCWEAAGVACPTLGQAGIDSKAGRASTWRGEEGDGCQSWMLSGDCQASQQFAGVSCVSKT